MSDDTSFPVPKTILQYQARRLRGNYINRPGSRKKGRWQVVAVHRLPAINHHDYERLDMEPMNRTEAIKVANTLNTLNNFPEAS